MSLKKISEYVNDRLPLFVGIGMIIAIHWGWYKIQQIPSLVKESERKELPVILLGRYLKRKATDGIARFSAPSNTENVEHSIESRK